MIEFSLKEGDRLQITGLRALIEIIVQLAFVWLAFLLFKGYILSIFLTDHHVHCLYLLF